MTKLKSEKRLTMDDIMTECHIPDWIHKETSIENRLRKSIDLRVKELYAKKQNNNEQILPPTGNDQLLRKDPIRN